MREAVYEAQVAAYTEDDAPTVHGAPFTALTGDLADRQLALISAGGVFRVDDDPMGPDGPTQQESLALIKDFLRGAPTLSEIPRDTPDAMLAARHPGYDARTAQRDPGTVFPLSVLRELSAEGAVGLADTHYSFTGATSQVRLREQVAPQWAQRLRAEGVDACLHARRWAPSALASPSWSVCRCAPQCLPGPGAPRSGDAVVRHEAGDETDQESRSAGHGAATSGVSPK